MILSREQNKKNLFFFMPRRSTFAIFMAKVVKKVNSEEKKTIQSKTCPRD